jgi:Dyp-type peroxidase family
VGGPVTARLELADVQGNVLHSFGHDPGRAAYLLLHCASPDAAPDLLRRLLPRVTRGDRRRPEVAHTLALTHGGFRALGVRQGILDRFPEAFRAMSDPTAGPERACGLGDVQSSDPGKWEWGLGRTHVMVAVHAVAPRYDEARHDLDALLHEVPGLEVVGAQCTRTLDGKVEHFGFRDGVSQPAVEGLDSTESRVRGGGVPLRDGSWRPVRAGEFLLGYPDEDGQTVTAPHPRLTRNGSYAVWRKLEQHVISFRKQVAAAADQAGLPPDLVAAKLVGRWPDGTPLELEPTRPEGSSAATAGRMRPRNDFRYLPHDRAGEVCPRGAHVRRTNPRDSIEFGTAVPETGQLTARHRIIRRGMPYGDPLDPDATEDDGQPRGLVFVGYQADLARQFEVVQRAWCADGDAFFLGDDQDPLLGNRPGKMTIPRADRAPRFVDTQPDLVVTKAMEYLFAPGLSALHALAAGTFS